MHLLSFPVECVAVVTATAAVAPGLFTGIIRWTSFLPPLSPVNKHTVSEALTWTCSTEDDYTIWPVSCHTFRIPLYIGQGSNALDRWGRSKHTPYWSLDMLRIHCSMVDWQSLSNTAFLGHRLVFQRKYGKLRLRLKADYHPPKGFFSRSWTPPNPSTVLFLSANYGRLE